MTIETIQFNIDNEIKRHKTVIDNLKKQIEQENNLHQQTIKSLRHQKENAIEFEKKHLKECYTLAPIERLNHQFELVFNELEN